MGIILSILSEILNYSNDKEEKDELNSEFDSLQKEELNNGNYESYNFEEEDLEEDDYYYDDDD